ncbi:MAG: energy transducer TonB [Pseudobacteriovorax sp.]|nr:energy transducer TonB [Pseudobacteriovorax sp.]
MRYILALGAGGAVTLLLFLFMSQLIEQGKKKPSDIDTGQMVEFIRVKRDQDTKTRSRQLPKKPPPQKPPPAKPKLQVADTDQPQQDDLQMQAPAIANGLKGGIGPYLGRGGGGGTSDASRIPIVRINPVMPRKAAMRGIEGFVQVQFTITKTGSTKDVKVIKAKPPRVFDRAAKKAILKWKYRPEVVDGQPIEVQEVVQLDFKLEDG